MKQTIKIILIEQAFTYVVFDSHLSLYKIGCSKNPKARFLALKNDKPTLELLFYFNGTTQTEFDLQTKFADKRTCGEWFKLEQTDIDWIKSNFETIVP